MSQPVKISPALSCFLLALIMLVISAPLLIQVTNCRIKLQAPEGAYKSERDTVLSWRDWFNGSYQDCKNGYITRNFKLHDLAARLYNQLDFVVFNKAHARDVVIGKENYLFERGHINAYYGEDFIGEEKIENYVSQLRCVQDTLAKHNKLLLLVIAPGKASFYPEYIPYAPEQNQYKRNYTEFKKAIDRGGLNHIDFNGYFADQKSKSKYPLYPKYGTHWSEYGCALAYDSMMKYIESYFKIDLPDLVIDSIAVTDSLQNSDRDILNGVNLYSEPPSFPMAYPKTSIRNDSTKNKNLNLLVAGDSFWWQAYNYCWPGAMFKTSSFWYYNELIYPESLYFPYPVKSSDYYRRLNNADVILIIHSEATLARFGRGFVELSHEVFCAPNPLKRELQEIKEGIYVVSPWYKDVQRKAAEKNISVDSMMTLDAIYVYDLKHPRH